MNKKNISIIVPVYNVEKYLRKCLESIFSQDYDNYEVIIVNDASTDNSINIIMEFCKKYNNKIFCIQNEKNSGMSFSRNQGIKYVIERGISEYIIFIDSDDYIEYNYVSTLLNSIVEKNADIIVCGQTQVDENDSLLRTVESTMDMVVEDRKYAMPSQVWSRIMRVDLIKKYQIFFSEGIFFEDVIYTLEINSVADSVKRINYFGYYHRVNTKSIFGTLRKNGLDDNKIPYKGLEEAIQFCNENGKYESEIIEIFVLRILTTFIFDFARGSKKEVVRHLCSYSYELLNKYFPNYYKNQYVKLGRVKCFSLFHRLAVWTFVKSIRFKLLYPFARIMTLTKKRHE